MRVRTEDGLILTGTAFEIIQQMRAMQWRVTETKGDYIAEVSRRVQDRTEIVPVDPFIHQNRQCFGVHIRPRACHDIEHFHLRRCPAPCLADGHASRHGIDCRRPGQR